jgi:hypothetical protein
VRAVVETKVFYEHFVHVLPEGVMSSRTEHARYAVHVHYALCGVLSLPGGLSRVTVADLQTAADVRRRLAALPGVSLEGPPCCLPDF